MTRDELLALKDWDVRAVPLPEYGKVVHVRTMDADAVVRVLDVAQMTEAARADPSRMAAVLDAMVGVVVAHVCGPDGTPTFGPDDVALVRKKSVGLVAALYAAVASTLADVDEVKKNTPATPPASTSPA